MYFVGLMVKSSSVHSKLTTNQNYPKAPPTRFHDDHKPQHYFPPELFHSWTVTQTNTLHSTSCIIPVHIRELPSFLPQQQENARKVIYLRNEAGFLNQLWFVVVQEWFASCSNQHQLVKPVCCPCPPFYTEPRQLMAQ